MIEKVNHPNHYNLPNRKECIGEIREKYGDCVVGIFCLTNAYKYMYRAGTKDGNSAEQDIAKAKWYFKYQENCKILNIWTGGIFNLLNDVARSLEEYGNNKTEL